MADERTPDQCAADDRFEDAIRDLLTAYGATDGPVMEWVLLTSQHIDDGDGSTSTALSHWLAPAQPLHRSLGLLDYSLTRLRAVIAGNADTALD